MEANALAEHQYSIGMSVLTLVEAMGLMAENQKAIADNKKPIYGKEDFDRLINKNGTYHNNLVTISQAIIS